MSSKFYHLGGYGLSIKLGGELEKPKSKAIPGLNAEKSHSKIPWELILNIRKSHEIDRKTILEVAEIYHLNYNTTRNILTYITRRNA